MDLGNALETAHRLRHAIASELERARGERHLLRTLDAEALFARAAERAAFLQEAARLERDVAVAIGRACDVVGSRDHAIERLRAAAPGPGDALAAALSEIRALTGALQEIDALNLQLAGRALVCVRGYVEALRPTPCAYDRRGARAPSAGAALVSSKG